MTTEVYHDFVSGFDNITASGNATYGNDTFNGTTETYPTEPDCIASVATVAYDYCIPIDDLSRVDSWIADPAFWPTIVVYGVTFTLGLIGNSLVVIALLCDRKSRNVTSLFLVSLAIADITFLLVCVPYETLAKLQTYWRGGRIFCKFAGFTELLSASASVLNLAAVSLERYVLTSLSSVGKVI